MVLITLAAALGGCVVIDEGGDQSIPVTKAVLPTTVQPYRRIDETLYCVRQTGVLRGRTFVVGPFADSTGKINAVAPGSTGNFMPQGGSAAYITDALAKAGARVVSTYFGPPKETVPAQYAINGIFNSLDFDTRCRRISESAGSVPRRRLASRSSASLSSSTKWAPGSIGR
jgi:hypothetical protein